MVFISLLGIREEPTVSDMRRNLGPSEVINDRVGFLMNILLSCYRDAGLITQVRGACHYGGLPNSRNSAVTLGNFLIRLRDRVRMWTGFRIDPVLMINKGKQSAQIEPLG